MIKPVHRGQEELHFHVKEKYFSEKGKRFTSLLDTALCLRVAAYLVRLLLG